VLIDREGIICTRHVGIAPLDRFEPQIESLL
jgi:hypothetical protein